MHEAHELFIKGDFVKSEKLFWQIYNSSNSDEEKISCLENIHLIYLKNNTQIGDDFYIQILTQYMSLAYFEKASELYKNIKSPNYNIKIIYLEIIWEQKNLDQFDSFAQQLGQEILANKKYVIAKNLFTKLIQQRKWYLYPYFLMLIYNLEIGDEINAKKMAMQIENLILNKWLKIEKKKKSQKEYLAHLKSLIEAYPIIDFEFICFIKFLELKLALLEGAKIESKLLIELVVIAKNNPDVILYLIHYLKNEKITEIVEKMLTPQIYSKLLDKDNPFKIYYTKTKTSLVKKDLNQKEEQYYPQSYSLEGTDDIYDPTIFSKYLKNENEEVKNSSDRLLMSYLRMNSEEYKGVRVDLVVALLSTGMLNSAKQLVDEIQDEFLMSYIDAELAFERSDYTGVIAITNKILCKNEVDIFQKIPFYYQKAQALVSIGKDSEAQNIYSLICTYNPKFRLALENLGND